MINNMSYYVYKHLDKNNNIIYVGQTKNIDKRQIQHKNYSKWFSEVYAIVYTELNDKLITDIYEKLYIDIHSPKYNKKDIDCKYSRFFKNMEDLEFKKYIFKNTDVILSNVMEKNMYFEANKNFELNDNFKSALYEILKRLKCSNNTDISDIKYKFLKQDFRILEHKLTSMNGDFRTYRELNEDLINETYDFIFYKIIKEIYMSYSVKSDRLKISNKILKCVSFIDLNYLPEHIIQLIK